MDKLDKYLGESGEGEGMSWDITKDQVDNIQKAALANTSTRSFNPSGKASFVMDFLEDD